MGLSHSLIRVGLTGGIAAGKSAVAQLWEAHGVPIVDADALARTALAPGSIGHSAVVREFGPAILQADGTINRPALAAIVFANAERRTVLNGIVHPIVRVGWQSQLQLWADDPRVALGVVAVPLLYETGVEKEFDYVVTVACSLSTQLVRLQAKGMDEAHARARIAAQWPPQKKMDRADFVIWNDGSRRLLAEQAEIILHRIKEINHAPQTV